jgi:hypothetical protein
MGPQYIKTAQSLHPLVPAYAVDCDTEANKPLCTEQVGLLVVYRRASLTSFVACARFSNT